MSIPLLFLKFPEHQYTLRFVPVSIVVVCVVFLQIECISILLANNFLEIDSGIYLYFLFLLWVINDTFYVCYGIYLSSACQQFPWNWFRHIFFFLFFSFLLWIINVTLMCVMAFDNNNKSCNGHTYIYIYIFLKIAGHRALRGLIFQAYGRHSFSLWTAFAHLTFDHLFISAQFKLWSTFIFAQVNFDQLLLPFAVQLWVYCNSKCTQCSFLLLLIAYSQVWVPLSVAFYI